MEQRMTTLTKEEIDEMIKNMLLASIISADNDEYPENIKQEVISRYNKYKDEDCWEYILNPLSDAGVSNDTIEEYANILRK